MADNARNLFFQTSLNQVAIRRASEAIAKMGSALPCRVTAVSGSIVTVAFEFDTSPWTLPPITIPKAESQWIRAPTQVGDFGLTVPSDVALGGISGLGGGTANKSLRANLTSLVWVPVAAKSFPGVDINAACVYGPNGAVIRDEASGSVITLTPSLITIVTQTDLKATVGGSVIEMSPTNISLTATAQVAINAPLIALNGEIIQTGGTSGGAVSLTGPVTVVNELTADGVGVATHTHRDAGGSGNSGPPNIPS